MGNSKRKHEREEVTTADILNWFESLSVSITSIDTELGGIAAVVESREWDESKTDYLLKLLGGLKRSVADLETELRDHVNGKLA